MGLEKLSLKSLSRRRAGVSEDTLQLSPGVNVLVGEGNTGKTKWLESIDYILGDDVSPEKRDDDDIFKLYDSISATLTIGREDLRDGFVTYLNRIVALNANSWFGQSVSIRLAERSFRIKVGESNWKTKLGATQKLYFFLAYHYALFPGFLMIDFPAKVEDGTTVADKENFLLEPFVELLKKKEMLGCQVIAAGRSFKDLKDVRRTEFTTIWKE
jgi:hypothetical protein